MPISTKIVRIPGQVVELVLEDGATVANALAAASIEVASGEAITVDGRSASPSTTLNDGARVILARSAKSA